MRILRIVLEIGASMPKPHEEDDPESNHSQDVESGLPDKYFGVYPASAHIV